MSRKIQIFTTKTPAIFLVILGLLLVPLAIPSKVKAAPKPGYIGKILYTSSKDGNDEIYVMDADGGNQTRLTVATGSDTP